MGRKWLALLLGLVLLLSGCGTAGDGSASAGEETVALVDTIAAIRDRGITVLLIEHDMRLVMQICEHLVVLENGTLIAQGTPDHVRNHPAVIEAYLGSDDSETW